MAVSDNPFLTTQEALSFYHSSDLVPDDQFLEPIAEDEVEEDDLYFGRNFRWDVSRSACIVEVPVDKIMFTEGNLWNFNYAEALIELGHSGDRPIFLPPAGRFSRIDEDDYLSSKKYYENGELEYQKGMTKPWTKRDIDSFYVQLIDGNHRALAAMILGEIWIPVAVGPNYRPFVRDDEML